MSSTSYTMLRRLLIICACVLIPGVAAVAFGQDGNPLDQAPPGNAAAEGLPAFLKQGARITYHVGDSVVPGVRSKLVQDPNGRWVDPTTGKRYSDDETRGSGGVAWYQVDILHASPSFIAGDGRSYLIIDQANNVAQATQAQGVTGDAGALGDIWIHPARLAQTPDSNDPGNRVSRVQYTLAGRAYNALAIERNGPSSYSSEIYDLDTGLLLSRGTSDTGGSVPTMGANNTPTPGKGSTVISHARFMSVRQLNLPWAGEAAPDWATQGRRLTYQGELRSVPNGNHGLPPLPGSAVTVTYDFQQATGGCVRTAMHARYDNGQGIPPTESDSVRCFASGMSGGLWLSPRAAAALQPNQLIDEDPITRRRTFFAGVQNNGAAGGGMAVIVEQGPTDQIEYAYELEGGLLVGSRTTQQMLNIGHKILEFRLAERR